MFIRAKYVSQFSRRNDLQNTGIDPAIENRRIVWTFMFEAAGRKVACENSRPSSLPARVAFHSCFQLVYRIQNTEYRATFLKMHHSSGSAARQSR